MSQVPSARKSRDKDLHPSEAGRGLLMPMTTQRSSAVSKNQALVYAVRSRLECLQVRIRGACEVVESKRTGWKNHGRISRNEFVGLRFAKVRVNGIPG